MMQATIRTQDSNDIAVIIPVWNGGQYLPECLTALSRQLSVEFDTFVVDNASSDDSADYVAAEWPHVRLIRSATNLGFSRACNLAVHEAGRRYSTLVLLQQDTEVLPDWLVHLVAPIRRNSSIGVAGSKALYPNGTIEHAGGRIDSRGIGRPVGRGQPDRRQFNAPAKAEYVSGTSFAFSWQAFASIGPFDEVYSPAAYEDMDWCYRARNAGYHVVYAPKSRLIHNTTDSSGEELNPFAFHRNRLRFILKHWSLHRIVDDFMPAEQRWLASIGAERAHLRHALHRAYLEQLVHVDDLVRARESAFAADPAEIHELAAVLLSLRTLYPQPAADLASVGARQAQDNPPLNEPEPSAARESRVARSLNYLARAGVLAPFTRPLLRFSNQQELAQTLVDNLLDTHREFGDMASSPRGQAPTNRNRASSAR